MAFFENTRIDGAGSAELSAVTYTQLVLDTGSSIIVNGITLTNTGVPYSIEIRVQTLSNPTGNVYAIGTPIEADMSPVVVTTSYFATGYIDDDYFE